MLLERTQPDTTGLHRHRKHAILSPTAPSSPFGVAVANFGGTIEVNGPLQSGRQVIRVPPPLGVRLPVRLFPCGPGSLAENLLLWIPTTGGSAPATLWSPLIPLGRFGSCGLIPWYQVKFSARDRAEKKWGALPLPP